MKTKLFFMSLCVTTLLASCGAPPKEENLREYHEALKPYFPYSANEKIVFCNEELDQTWEVTAYSKNNTYPNTHIDYNDVSIAESYGMWIVDVDAPFLEKDGNQEDGNMSSVYASIHGMHKKASFGWDIYLRIGGDKQFWGIYGTSSYPHNEIYTLFVDTVVIPIRDEDGKDGHGDAPAGAYARIVKHQGLTDFSTDGKTVWRRVK